MVTYNQEKYVAKAIESVLMQITTFQFRLLIGEDCSTDKTLEVCRKYADEFPDKIVLTKNVTNLGLVKNYKRQFDACTAKYIAILEGDDYWNDENKLQNEVEILEHNSSIGLVHGNFYILTHGAVSKHKPPKGVKLEGNVYNDLIIGNYIGPLTVCFRKSLLDKYVDFNIMIENNYQTIDYAIWLDLAYHSDFAYINKEVATYRKQEGSISVPKSFHEIEVFHITVIKILAYFKSKYPTDEGSIEIAYNSINYNLMLKAIHFNEFAKVNHYNSLSKPVGIIQNIRWLAAKSGLIIKLGKLIKLFN